MARQTPLLYVIVISSMLTIAYIHLPIAPSFLTLFWPSVLLVADLAYMFWFIHIPAKLGQKDEDWQMRIRLHSTIWSSLLLGGAYVVWLAALFEYGNPQTRGILPAFIGITTLGGALCLMHLRASALALIVAVIVPLSVFLWSTGEMVFMAAAFNLTTVAVAFAIVLNGYARDYVNLNQHRKNLEAKQLETQALSEENFRLANLDSLTGLANRRSFLSSLQAAVQDLRWGEEGSLAVGILDLDGFKLINDVYGHPVGDRLLEDIGPRLTSLLCDDIFIARLGGDEFGLIVRNRPGDEVLLAIGERVCDAMAVPFDLRGLAAHIGGSVGFARYQDSSDTEFTLFEKADYALYHAKENARGETVIFNDSHAAQIREVSGVNRRLQDADLDEEMSLVFQPIIKTAGATAIGLEVLARWHSPVLGSIPPDVFIRAAERAGMINQLTEVLLKKALNEARNWPGDVFMSFNLSMQDITSPKAILRLIGIVSRSGFDPSRITFEVTETAVMSDYERAVDSLELLRNLGAKIALDDFGSGQSSLGYVRSLPLDKVKVDRSFIAGIETDKTARAIVHTVIVMCEKLGVECIVEGVETEKQLDILSAMGCSIIQGYYFSRPLEAASALRYLQAERKIAIAG